MARSSLVLPISSSSPAQAFQDSSIPLFLLDLLNKPPEEAPTGEFRVRLWRRRRRTSSVRAQRSASKLVDLPEANIFIPKKTFGFFIPYLIIYRHGEEEEEGLGLALRSLGHFFVKDTDPDALTPPFPSYQQSLTLPSPTPETGGGLGPPKARLALLSATSSNWAGREGINLN